MKRRHARGVVAMVLTLATAEAMAINGLIFYGVGARNRAMGGANGAFPVDTSTILTNPAGLGEIGTTADFGAHILKANRFIEVKGPLANPNAGKQDSDQTIYITPFTGMSWKAEGSRWTVGGMLAGVAGEGARFDRPRINPDFLFEPDGTTPISQTGDEFDTQTLLFVLKAIPAVSYDVSDRFRIGAGLHISAAFFSADLARFNDAGRLVETDGRGRTEISYGLALGLGFIYDFNDQWSVGVSGKTPDWFVDDFGPYEDLIPDFELPPEVRVGLAYHPTPRWTLTADYKWIGWETVDLFDDLPLQGGFGWRDQHTVGVGAQYEMTKNWTVRGGVNHGRSPIRKDNVFANALSPAVYETHLSVGGEYHLDEHNSIAFNVVRTLPNREGDNGGGDAISAAGAGTELGYDGWDADVTWSIRF